MNSGQKMFHDFFIGLVKEGHEAEAEELLQKGFEMQDKGAFHGEFFESVKDKYFELIKPEFTEKLQAAMNHFTQGK